MTGVHVRQHVVARGHARRRAGARRTPRSVHPIGPVAFMIVALLGFRVSKNWLETPITILKSFGSM